MFLELWDIKVLERACFQVIAVNYSTTNYFKLIKGLMHKGSTMDFPWIFIMESLGTWVVHRVTSSGDREPGSAVVPTVVTFAPTPSDVQVNVPVARPRSNTEQGLSIPGFIHPRSQ